MKIHLALSAAVVSLLIQAASASAQDEIGLNPAQAKITTVSAMRARKAPQATAEEVTRLQLGTVVTATNRSGNQDTIAGKTDYWYWVNLPNGQKGWLFGGLLMDYDPSRRTQLVRQIIEARLRAEQTDFADRQEIYELAVKSVSEAKVAKTRAEFELLKLLALAHWAGTVDNEKKNRSPYREFLAVHKTELVENEFGGGYDLRTELLWNLEAKYHMLPVADRIAWEAARNEQPSDCESDEVCGFFLFDGDIKYLGRHPTGAHAAEALNNLSEALTDDVIKTANSSGGDKYLVEQRNELRKSLASLRAALAKVSSREKSELTKKLARVK